jgi:hypothetical protein
VRWNRQPGPIHMRRASGPIRSRCGFETNFYSQNRCGHDSFAGGSRREAARLATLMKSTFGRRRVIRNVNWPGSGGGVGEASDWYRPGGPGMVLDRVAGPAAAYCLMAR